MKASDIDTGAVDRARMERLSHRLNIRMTAHAFVQLLNASLAAEGDYTLTPSPPEMQIARGLVKWLAQNKVKASSFVAFSIENWGAIRRRCLWPDGRKSMLGDKPNLRDMNKGCKEILALLNSSTASSRDDQRSGVGQEVYTSIDQVPPNHPHLKFIVSQIQKKGKAVLAR